MLLQSNICASRKKIRKADLPWWPCETFSGVMSHACTVQSTSIGLSPTSQNMEYYGILRWITVTMDYSGLQHNLELRNDCGVNYELPYGPTKNP
jgi:hypothetical protein